MSEDIIIKTESYTDEQGKRFEVVLVEVERIELTQDDLVSATLLKQGLDESQVEDALLELKEKGVL